MLITDLFTKDKDDFFKLQAHLIKDKTIFQYDCSHFFGLTHVG